MEKLMASCQLDRDYADAFSGFDYSLENYTNGGEGSAWVAYVSSKRVNGPLYLENDLDVTSSDIKMALMFKISVTFYSVSGIFRSPIGKAFDKRFGIDIGNLSMPLQSFIARTMWLIRPSIKYMVMRPLDSVINVLKTTEIHYSVSHDGEKQDKVPHIQWEKGKKCGPCSSYHVPRNFALVDPLSNTRYNISDKHWFCNSSYLGYSVCEFLEESPFIVIDRTELGNYYPIELLRKND